MMLSRDRLAAYVALIAVCFFWGTTYVTIRMALETFPPAVLVATRFLISGSILLLVAWLRGAHLPRGRELRNSALSGILILGVGNSALAWAELLIPSGLASLFITISPFWFVIFEALLPGGERLHFPTIAGMVVGFAGTALLFLPGAGALQLQTLAGFAILQVGVISWCLGSILQRRQTTRAHPVVTGAVQQLASSAMFVPLAIGLPHSPLVWKTRAVWAVFYLITFGSIVGYSAYAYAIAHLPVAIVSIYPYVNSVVAVALGAYFYGEHFGLREFSAMLVIFAGIAIVKWQTALVERRALEEKAA